MLRGVLSEEASELTAPAGEEAPLKEQEAELPGPRTQHVQRPCGGEGLGMRLMGERSGGRHEAQSGICVT